MSTLEEHTAQIVMLAWSRMLGLEDTALQEAAPGERLEVPQVDASALSLLQLFGRSALVGPAAMLADARSVADEELALESRLLSIARPHAIGARALGEAELLYCEESPEISGSEHVAVSFEPTHVQQLLSVSPRDDAARSGLGEASWTAAAVRESTGEVLAAAGREEWQQILGHIGVLTVPERRQLGVGRFIAAVATQEALLDGLVPQWRAAAETPGSLRMAISLGYTRAGHQTTVLLD